MSAVNQVVDDWLANGKMNQYMDYYTALANEENGGEAAVAPDGLQTSWDFGSASEVVTMYTESGFAPWNLCLHELLKSHIRDLKILIIVQL